ncbi:hypothetical protein IHE44_0003054 [Lamprotornis superbus]|uniref:Palmitoyltransferase n=2 Tax=Passeriformes TaxID=9126 RepID=A0A835NSW7_9PASS|nr:hypothetical protein IHE44_0003054 [Lamprotornis superbus]
MALWRGLRCCRRAFAWLPVLLIALLLLWSYYAYVYELCLVAYLVVFHILFVLFVWTYWKSVFTLPIQPGKKFHMSYADQERYENEERPEVQRQILAEIARKLPVYTRTGNGGIRFCDRCQLIKPDRCHHCSVCAMCVLKMDHHCPWVNNCIGFSNYKFFLLFLAYSLLYCLYIAATVFKYFLKYWTVSHEIRLLFHLLSVSGALVTLGALLLSGSGGAAFSWEGELTNGRSKFHILFLLFVAIMFFVSLMFLFGYHCWLVSRNRSTLEAFSAPVFQNGPDKNGFNLGFVKNLQQVFGEEKKLWLLPIASSQGDGHFFPMRALSEARNPLLTNEEQWEEDGIDEEPQGANIPSLGKDFSFEGQKTGTKTQTEHHTDVSLCGIVLSPVLGQHSSAQSLPLPLTVRGGEEAEQDDDAGLDPVFHEHFDSLDHRVPNVWGELGVVHLGSLRLLVALDQDFPDADGSAAVPQALLHGLPCKEQHTHSSTELVLDLSLTDGDRCDTNAQEVKQLLFEVNTGWDVEGSHPSCLHSTASNATSGRDVFNT